MPKVEFRLVRWANQVGSAEPGKTLVFLESDSWNDFSWETLFTLHVVSAARTFSPGSAKILHVAPGTETPVHRTASHLQPAFPRLPAGDFCSLGQSVDYYMWFKAQGDVGLAILQELADVCLLSPSVRERWSSYPAFKQSLLRFSDAQKAFVEGPDIMAGIRTSSSDQSFSYSVTLDGASGPHKFDFAFDGSANPSSRLNVLIGINGVGKTTVLSHLAEDLSTGLDRNDLRTFPRPPRNQFSRQILVSTTPFDSKRRPVHGNASSYRFVGPRWRFDELRSRAKRTTSSPIDEPWAATLQDLFPSPDDLLAELSAEVLPPSERHLESLSSPDLSEVLAPIVSSTDLEAMQRTAAPVFSRLSAGQQALVTVLCGLWAEMDEESLVLLDEPESHLHPQYLRMLVRALHELLHKRSSYAIVSTHSPVILQGVPAQAVHVVERDGTRPSVRRPFIQTFGATLPALVIDIFGLDRDGAWWTAELTRLVSTGMEYEAVCARFIPPLDPEARMLLIDLLKERK